MTRKENFLRVCRGEKPLWVPSYDRDCQYLSPEALEDPAFKLYEMYDDYKAKGLTEYPEWKDVFGVTWILDDFGPIVKPNCILIEDVTEWREVYHIPTLEGYDWDAACARDAANLDPNKAVELALVGVFGHLTNAMGFMGAMEALATEQEAVEEMFDALCCFHEKVIENVMARIHCDLFQVADDFASSTGLFVSPECYRKMIKPYHKRLIDAAKRANPDVIIQQHTCGQCESVMDDIVENGVQVWQPAQSMNDLKGIQKKYQGRLVLNGVWDNFAVCQADEMTEAQVKASVREVMDTYAADGGMIFWDGGPMGSSEKVLSRLAWANEEANRYGDLFYQR